MDSPKDNAGGRGRSIRSNHRARNHESAHAESAQGDTTDPQVSHPLVSTKKASVVQTQPQLTQLIEQLRQAGRFAYDSEFIGELSYVPKLCLIQVAWTADVVLIDPLAKIDLRPFWELVADPSVEKVVHAGEQDVEPVFRHLGRPPRNLFDTQIAAGFVGLPYPLSLSKLILEIVNAKLGKGLTFTHWDERPLSEAQLRYAADDVRYLPAVREALEQQMPSRTYLDWAREESAELAVPGVYQFDPERAYLRVRGMNALNSRQVAVLKELTIWRDQAARVDDVPPRSLLKDEIMVALARSPVKTVEKLDQVRGLPRPVEKTHGQTLVEAMDRGTRAPAANMPIVRTVEPTPREKVATDALWSIVQAHCFSQRIDPNLVTSRQEVGDLWRAIVAEPNPSEAKSLRILQGWRRIAVGQWLLDLLDGRAALKIDWRHGVCQPVS